MVTRTGQTYKLYRIFMKHLLAYTKIKYAWILLLRGTYFFVTICFGLAHAANAQDKCATVEYKALKSYQYPLGETDAVFERWMETQHLINNTFQTLRTHEEIRIIPVVVHIIHKGEAVGQGANLSVERILSQIKSLNEDFRRFNADTVNTPAIFLPVATDTKIEFVLAQRDPEGLSTNGIVRVKANKTSYSISDDVALKSQSYWPAEDYLNIWVAPLSSQLLGYAEFPVSDLPGLEDAEDNRLLDGVVVDFNYFGFNPTITPRSLGRTATHEVGHFLGLRHIWGDGGCDVDDYIEDTPQADKEHYTCASEVFSCGTRNMIENYMDYTNDVCMNLFTEGQKQRMDIVLANSPRRKSLLNSNGGLPAVLVDNNVGLRKIITPNISYCSNTFVPEIQIRNYGSNEVNSIEISLKIDGQPVETVNRSLSLNSLDTTNISFSPVILPYGAYQLAIEILKINGSSNLASDQITFNSVFNIREPGEAPFVQRFDILPDNWLIINPDQNVTWQIVNAPGNGINNKAASLDFFDYENGRGQTDYLLTPSVDLSNLTSAKLSFKIAYARYNREFADGLVIAVSTDCGNTFPEGNVIYRKYSAELATVPDQVDPFIPSSRTDWRQDTLDLSRFIGLPNVQIGFLGQNGFGNILYLDDVSVLVERTYDLDLALTKVISPFPATCEDGTAPSIEVLNKGRLPVNDFKILYSINGNPPVAASFTNLSLQRGESQVVTLPGVPPGDGKFIVQFDVSEVNGLEDENDNNDVLSYAFVVDKTEDLIPIRDNFNVATLDQSNWTAVSQDNAIGWELKPLKIPGAGKAATVENYNYDAIGAKDYLVSPVLDFSKTRKASMFFSVAYGVNQNFSDKLSILVSEDCGRTFADTIYVKSGDVLSTASTTDFFEPGVENDFRREFIDLSVYAGKSDMRFAFENTNAFGNNIYLDNIEFFVDDDPTPVNLEAVSWQLYPNPAYYKTNITFNLADKEDVHIAIYDAVGKQLIARTFPNTLNQTYPFILSGLQSGIYYVKVSSTSLQDIRRIIVSK